MLPEDGIEVELAGEDAAEEMAAAAGIGEEVPALHLVAISPNWRRLHAPEGARLAATGSLVLGVHWSDQDGEGRLRPKRRSGLTVVQARVRVKREKGGAMGAYKGRRELPG